MTRSSKLCVLVAVLAICGLSTATESADPSPRQRMADFIKGYTEVANKPGKDDADKAFWVGSFTKDGVLNDPANSLPFKGEEEVSMAYDGLFANLDTFFTTMRPDMFTVSADGKSGSILRIQIAARCLGAELTVLQLVSATQHTLGSKYEFHFPAWIRYNVDLSGSKVKITELIACWDKIGAKLDEQYKAMGWRKTILDAVNAKNAAFGLGISRALAYGNSISDSEKAAGSKALDAASRMAELYNKAVGSEDGRSATVAALAQMFASTGSIVTPDGKVYSGKDAITAALDGATRAGARMTVEHTFLSAWRLGAEAKVGSRAVRFLLELEQNDDSKVKSLHVYYDTAQ